MTYTHCYLLGFFQCTVCQSFNPLLMVFSKNTKLSTKHKFILFFCVMAKKPLANWVGICKLFGKPLVERWLVWACQCAYK